MVQAALYIKKKLIDDKILDMAWEKDEVNILLFLSCSGVHLFLVMCDSEDLDLSCMFNLYIFNLVFWI